MSDLLSQLLGADGCAQDGSLASNPVGHMMNTVFEGPNAIMGNGLGSGTTGEGMFLQPSGPSDWTGEFSGGTGGQMMQQQQTGMMNAAFAEAQAAQMQQHHAAIVQESAFNQQARMQDAWSMDGGQHLNRPMSGHAGGPGMMMGGGGGMEMAAMMQMQQMQQMQHMQRMSMMQQPQMQHYQQQQHPVYQQHHQQQQAPGPAYDMGGLRHAASEVAATLSSHPDPKYADSELHQFVGGLAQSHTSGGVESAEPALDHGASATSAAAAGALKQGEHGESGAVNAAAATTETAGSAVVGVDEMPPEVREKMEAAFAEAMASNRAAEEAEFAEYEALLRQHQASAATASAAPPEVYHEGGTNPAWARTAAALEALGDPLLQPYAFVGDNPALAPLLERAGSLSSEAAEAEVDSCFRQGMELFERGLIPEAVQQFEAAVQLAGKVQEGAAAGAVVAPSVAECWRMLGACHQESDEDRKAIVCLERAVDEDPYNLDALLSLGVSYVNELDSPKALHNLKAWVEHHPAYHGLEVESEDNDAYGDGSLMDHVMQLMTKAAAFADQEEKEAAAAAAGAGATAGGAEEEAAAAAREERAAARADVQVVLGVLYNVSRDFDAAAHALATAAALRPLDYSAWNKLGATRANNSASEEALPAYHRALQLKPRYARGWLNLGIAHANLGHQEAAARAYLHALELNPRAQHIWNYLRMTLGNLDRFDLVQLASQQSVGAFREHFPPIPNDDPTALLSGAAAAAAGAGGGGAGVGGGGGGGGGLSAASP